MIGILKRSWWLGPFVVTFAVATIATVQATITIGGAVIHATSAKPPASQDPQLYAASSFEERWPPAVEEPHAAIEGPAQGATSSTSPIGGPKPRGAGSSSFLPRSVLTALPASSPQSAAKM